LDLYDATWLAVPARLAEGGRKLKFMAELVADAAAEAKSGHVRI
jgi:hypothetical protein